MFQVPPCIADRHPDQSSGLGAHRHAKRATPNQDLSRETLVTERRHAGKDAPLQPALGTAGWDGETETQSARVCVFLVLSGKAPGWREILL